MKRILGLLLIVGGIALGLYVGVYLCLFCGVVGVVEAVKVNPVDSGKLAWGLVRIFPLAELLGWLSFMACVIPGFAFLFGKK